MTTNTLERSALPQSTTTPPKAAHVTPSLPATSRERDLGRILTATEKLRDDDLARLRWIAENIPDIRERCAAITSSAAEPALAKNTFTATPREHTALGALLGLLGDIDRAGGAQ